MQTFAQKLYARLVTTFTSDEEGQTMAEYGVVLALITLAVVATLLVLGTTIDDKLKAVVKAMTPGP